MSHQIFKIMFAGVVATALSSTVHAQTLRSVKVHTQDLNLTSDAGRAALQDRIRGAVNNVCSTDGWGSGVEAKRFADACRASVTASAAPQVEAVLKAAQSRQVASRDISLTAH